VNIGATAGESVQSTIAKERVLTVGIVSTGQRKTTSLSPCVNIAFYEGRPMGQIHFGDRELSPTSSHRGK
jgi:hypothetical protein